MFKELIRMLDGPQRFRLIDETHLLDLYGGFDSNGRKCLLLVTSLEISHLKNTQYIEVFIENTDKNYIFFSLKDEQFIEQFYLFADDLIEYSRHEHTEINGTRKYIQRYLMWKNLFGNEKTDILSFEKIKGLFAELTFLKNNIFNRYGVLSGINSWLGPDKAKRDFEVSDYWYEIKAASSDSTEIKISSVSQLDDPIIGDLVIIRMEKTNFENDVDLSLYNLVEIILEEIKDFNIQDIFLLKLNEYGYRHDQKYKHYSFHVKDLIQIEINEESQIIRRKELPKSVHNVSYTINYNLINEEC